MNSIIVLGADRVGKSTAIRNSVDLMKKCGYKTEVCHFSGILPWHHSPSQQFVDALRHIEPERIDHLLLDRFVSDTLFYEPYRYKMPVLNNSVCAEAESVLSSISNRVSIIVVVHEWDEEMENRHREELVKLNQVSSLFWINSQIEKRRLEHLAYYDHTWRYVHTVTSFENIYELNSTSYDETTIRLEGAKGFDYSSLKAK